MYEVVEVLNAKACSFRPFWHFRSLACLNKMPAKTSILHQKGMCFIFLY